MSNLIEELKQIEVDAAAGLDAVQTVADSEAWYSDWLGRKGRLTTALRGLGELSREERPAAGRRPTR